MSVCKTGMFLMHNAIAFVRWADSFHRPITAEDIRNRWDVSRATSYRWLAAYNNAPTREQVSAGHAQVQA